MSIFLRWLFSRWFWSLKPLKTKGFRVALRYIKDEILTLEDTVGKFLIEQSAPLHGEVEISGAKNAVLPIMAATILAEDDYEINDAPQLRDVDVMCRLLRQMGADVKEDYSTNTIHIKMGEITAEEVPYDMVKRMRASFFVLGPLLAKTGRARIALPGGCAIGDRPVELHLKGLRILGAQINEGHGYVEAVCDRLKGGKVYLDFPSVGATENIMMAATLAEGSTIIENAAQEPEIVDLANFLNKMGAKIKGAGTDTIKIEGVEVLHGCRHTVIPDRIETGTFMVAAAISRGNILIKNAVSDHVKPVIAKLIECGVSIEETEEGMRVRGDVNPLIATDIKTLPYPGFPTDMQAQFMALLTTVEGPSVVIENVFENRFMHVGELNRMGANIKIDGKSSMIPGGKQLYGAEVICTDLRGGAAVVLAGLVAEGHTEVSEIYHVDRGYEKFVEKLTGLGAKISRIDEE
ncbi:MAG: UDP-N-acetylglucosamine 1-carboxyvinyltransferase [Firmicutes bacterium]|nr:UDP-N-acetylglucosamine 1-carboxyvinyltransferase [Bacillota bacterium]